MLSGPDKVLSGSEVSLECVTAPSTPAASITWSVTQAGERLQYSPSQSVEQLEDGSFVTRSWLEVMATTTGHDMVAECYATNQVMDNDFIAFAHVIEIMSKYTLPSLLLIILFLIPRTPWSTQYLWSITLLSCAAPHMFYTGWQPSC